MNNIQQRILNIAKEYIRICNELNLRYFAFYGTALGAVRHNGFIPWDDDMDFGMPRKDYEIFLREAKKLLPFNYFIDNNLYNERYFFPYTQIRCFDKASSLEEIDINNLNNMPWIDIFPIDGLPASLRKRKRLNNLDKLFLRRRYQPCLYTFSSRKQKIFYAFVKVLFPSRKIAYKISIHNMKKYELSKSAECWCCVRTRLDPIDASVFKDFINVKFEDITLRVPVLFDKYLTITYGNWRKIPEEKDRVTGHKPIPE